MAEKTEHKVFIASPNDLAEERRVFRDFIVDDLTPGFGDGFGCEFVPLGWEDTLASSGRRAQSTINLEIGSCDVFVLVLNRRWGQPATDSEFSSYTEEEFHFASSLFAEHKKPEIFVFFKTVDRESLADPGPQLEVGAHLDAGFSAGLAVPVCPHLSWRPRRGE